MRIWAIAAAGTLAATVSVAAIAAPAKKAAAVPNLASFEACEQKAMKAGVPHGQAGHSEYIRECMGKRPANSHSPS